MKSNDLFEIKKDEKKLNSYIMISSKNMKQCNEATKISHWNVY